MLPFDIMVCIRNLKKKKKKKDFTKGANYTQFKKISAQFFPQSNNQNFATVGIFHDYMTTWRSQNHLRNVHAIVSSCHD